MASFLAREVRITYGSLVIGDSEDLQPTGQIEITKTDDSFVVQFEFVYSVAGLADPGAAYETGLQTIDDALRNRSQTLLVEYGPGLTRTLLDLTQATGDTQDTGLSVRAQWSRTNNNLNTNRSSHYFVQITGGLPPSDPARAGRRSFDTSIVFDSSRRIQATFSGEWTRVGATSATAGYLAGIDDLITGVMGYLTTNFTGRTFEKIDEAYTPNEPDDVVGYQVVYQELLIGDPGAGMGVLDNPELADTTLVVTRSRREGTGPDGVAEPLVSLTAILTTRVDAELNQPMDSALVNVGTTRLDALIEESIKNYMVAALQEAVGGNTVAVTSFSPDLDPTTNQLRVAMEAVSAPGGRLLERVLFTQDGAQTNTILRKAYPNGTERDQPVPSSGDANLFDQPLVKIPRAWAFTTAGAVRRRITDQRIVIGAGNADGSAGNEFLEASSAGAGAAGSGGAPTPGPGQTRTRAQAAAEAGSGTPSIVISRQFSVRNSVRGIQGLGVQIPVLEVNSVIELEFYAPITGGGGAPAASAAGGTSTGGSAGSERPTTGG